MDHYQGAGSVLMQGSLLAEAQRVRVATKSNANPVKTMRKGLAGRSRGAPTVEITVENAVPRAGLEQPYVEACQVDADISIVVYYAGKRYQYDGWIDSVDGEMSVENAASCSLTIMAGPAIVTGG